MALRTSKQYRQCSTVAIVAEGGRISSDDLLSAFVSVWYREHLREREDEGDLGWMRLHVVDSGVETRLTGELLAWHFGASEGLKLAGCACGS